MRNKSDNRSDNARKIRENIENTKENIELSNQTISATSNENAKHDIEEKNKRRHEAIRSMEDELEDERDYNRW